MYASTMHPYVTDLHTLPRYHKHAISSIFHPGKTARRPPRKIFETNPILYAAAQEPHATLFALGEHPCLGVYKDAMFSSFLQACFFYLVNYHV